MTSGSRGIVDMVIHTNGRERLASPLCRGAEAMREKARPAGTALYLRFAPIEPPFGVSPFGLRSLAQTGRRRCRRRFSVQRESGAPPPSPSNGNLSGRGSLASLTAPAPPRQIPAAPSPPAARHEAGPMAEAIARGRYEERNNRMDQDNRESWLNRVAIGMAPLFEELYAPLPSRVRVAIGFTSRGAKGKAIGECWDNRCSGDAHFEIFIQPDLAHAPDAMPAQIAAVLAHELVHAAVGIPAGHGKPFKRDAFFAAVTPILTAAGPLPHARLDTDSETTRPKKQATRLLKCECETCGYTVRTARKWLETAGAPICPIEDHGPMRCDLPDDEGSEGRTDGA